MGSATIVSEQGGGEYIITPIYDIGRMQFNKVQMIQNQTELQAAIVVGEAIVAQLELEKIAFLDELDIAITLANANLDDNGEFAEEFAKLVIKATKEITDINITLVDNERVLAGYRLTLLTIQLELKNISSAESKYDPPTNRTAWCTDLTEGLTGDISILEISDESNTPNDQPSIISPNGLNTDNIDIQPVLSSGSWAIAYNLAAMPAFQKWEPRYRAAIISNIDNELNTCRVSFTGEYEFSSVVGEFNTKYSIFQEQAIDNVPVEYMTCDSAAFESGDNVVVYFEGDQATPKVIGFIDNPKPCVRLYARHALGRIFEYFTDPNTNPIFITDLDDVPGSELSPLNIIQGFGIKRNDVYTVIGDSIRKNGSHIGTVSIFEPAYLTCRQDDDFIFISGRSSGFTEIQVEKFNIVTNVSIGVIINEATVGSPYPLRLTDDNMALNYFDSNDDLQFGIWDKNGLAITDVPNFNHSAEAYWVGSSNQFFTFTQFNGTDYEFHFLNEIGTDIGVVTPDITDYLPNFSTHGLASIMVIDTQLWLASAVNLDFTFWTVYQLDITYFNGVPTNVVLGNNGNFLFQKTTAVNHEFNFQSGWINAQTT